MLSFLSALHVKVSLASDVSLLERIIGISIDKVRICKYIY